MDKLALLFAFSAALAAGSPSRAPGAEPDFARTYYERGREHEEDDRYAEALADYSRAIKLDPNFVEAYFSRSSIYAWSLPAVERDYGKAVADLTELLEIEPSSSAARFNRAQCYENLQQYDDAIADYSEAIERPDETSFAAKYLPKYKNESLANVYHYRGRAYHWYKADYAKAVADYSEALRLMPHIQLVRFRRGQAYNALKDYEQAAHDFKEALARQPNLTDVQAAYAWQLAACPDPQFRDAQAALYRARRANEARGYSVPDYLEALAAACAEGGKFDEAVEWQKKALERFASQAEGSPKTQAEMQARLALYEAHKPYRTK